MKEHILALLESLKKKQRKKEEIQKELEKDPSFDFSSFQDAWDDLINNQEILLNHGIYATRKQLGIHEGIISINRSGNGYVSTDEMRYFISFEDLKGAMDKDLVRIQHCYDGTAEVIKVLEHRTKTLAGYFQMKNQKLQFHLYHPSLDQRYFKVNIPKDFTPEDGMMVICEIEKYERPFTIRVQKSLGKKDEPGADILATLINHDIYVEFPEEVIEEASQIPQSVLPEEKEGRKDLTEELTITIDGDDSKDFDDAVSITKEGNNYNLKVSIADVSHYVKEGSALDEEARLRGTSTYVIDRVVPMLPKVLSNGICSLNPNEERLAITCEMHIDQDGTIKDYELYPSVILSKERMTYRNCNAIYDGDEEVIKRYQHLVGMLEELKNCAQAIRKQREKKGAINFDTTESDIIVDDSGKTLDVKEKERGISENIIEDCMIAANICVANEMKWKEIPSIYRVHEEPQARRIRDFVEMSKALHHPLILGKSSIHANELQKYLEGIEGTDVFPILSKSLLRCMQKAKYDAVCKGHFGLAEEEYLHFTSPIRRYPDLIVHRMLRKYVFNQTLDVEEVFKDQQKCETYAELSSIRERLSQDAEYAVEDMKKAEYMEDHIGEIYDGMISGVSAHGFYVRLPNTIEGLVPIRSLSDDYYIFDSIGMCLYGEHRNKEYHIGDAIKVEVKNANKEVGVIDFVIANTQTKSKINKDEGKKTNAKKRRR